MTAINGLQSKTGRSEFIRDIYLKISENRPTQIPLDALVVVVHNQNAPSSFSGEFGRSVVALNGREFSVIWLSSASGTKAVYHAVTPLGGVIGESEYAVAKLLVFKTPNAVIVQPSLYQKMLADNPEFSNDANVICADGPPQVDLHASAIAIAS